MGIKTMISITPDDPGEPEVFVFLFEGKRTEPVSGPQNYKGFDNGYFEYNTPSNGEKYPGKICFYEIDELKKQIENNDLPELGTTFDVDDKLIDWSDLEADFVPFKEKGLTLKELLTKALVDECQ